METLTTAMAAALYANGTNNDSDILFRKSPPEGCKMINWTNMTQPHLNPKDLVSYETQQQANFVINVVLLTILFFVSVPTNLLNMIVFYRHGLKERINVCLFWLSFADLVVVLTHFEWNLDTLIGGQPSTLVIMKWNIDHKIHYLAGFIYVSGFMSTLIALERCFCLVYPFKFKHMIQTRTTVIIVAVGSIIIFGSHCVIAARWEVNCWYDSMIHQHMLFYDVSEFYMNNKAHVDTFGAVMFGLLLPGSYVVVTTAATVVTVVKLRKQATTMLGSKSSDSSGPGKDVTLTLMLIGASCLFVVCTLPPLVFHAMLFFVPQLSLTGDYFNAFLLGIAVQQCLIYVNSSVNFFLYFAFGTKFRRSVKSMYGALFRGRCCGRRCWRKEGKDGVSSSLDTSTGATFTSRSGAQSRV